MTTGSPGAAAGPAYADPSTGESGKALAFLARLARDFTAVLSLSDLLEHMLRGLREETGFDSCAVSLLDTRDPEKLAVRATSGLRGRLRGKVYRRGEGLLWAVMDTVTPLTVPDMHTDPRTHRPDPQLRSAIYAPLMVHRRPIGVLSAYRATPGAFTEADLDLLTVVARYLAGAIEVARLHEQLKELAATDSLTGLANRRGFLDRLQMEMDRGRRAGTVLCVALLDLNQFKRVNDAHGHAAGDDVLLSVAETLSEAIRETDVAGRFGGDEFILLFPDTTAAEAEEVLDYLRDLEIAVPAREGLRARISFSWGIASWPGDGVDVERLLQVADRRLYAMKEAAGGQTVRLPGTVRFPGAGRTPGD